MLIKIISRRAKRCSASLYVHERHSSFSRAEESFQQIQFESAMANVGGTKE